MSGTGNASFFRSLPLIQVINTPKPVSRDLSVAYGVLPDPVDGMKLFSVSDALDALASGRRHELFFTDEWSFDGEALRGDDGEWCREQQFIGIDSPDRYDGYMSGDDSQSVFGVLDFSLPTDRLEVRFCLRAFSHLAVTFKRTKIKIQKEGRPITKTCKNIQSPSSVLTFAALWDPDTGFTAYEKGKLLSRHKTRNFAGHRPFNPLVDTSVSNLPTTHLYHPRVSESRMHNHAIPSSTLEGLADPWHFPFFDPLSVPAEFKEPNSSVRFQVRFSQEGVYLSDCIDPEGFFESFADHPDCEPYLVVQCFPLP